MSSFLSFFPSRTVAVEIFGFSVHWYGVMYVLAFLLALFLLPRLQKWRGLNLTSDDWSNLLTWIIIGVLVGGRLGYVFFYDPGMIVRSPLEVFAVWNGGMSSHGGFLGVGIAILGVAWSRNIPILKLLDIIIVPAAIGLSFGRVGNFINQELYGIPTNLPWGIAIPGVEGLRHPTQFYAVAKDLFIAIICYVHLRKTLRERPGGTFTLFLFLYGVLRFLLETLREQGIPPVSLGFVTLTRGQFLTLPLILISLILLVMRRTQREKSS